ncbi:hypothetical protein GOP47_0024682 [Adiantum capillus-veneris]|uniref:COI1 F-box domain-containing protein n=1 Tax=Adiantum capillus-veneris TaxID=13818 RepID=A0A9D4Z4K4_ADICA|nr:hypothetical protein GOP47_0024682 [Adiantum capillus-veneris]
MLECGREILGAERGGLAANRRSPPSSFKAHSTGNFLLQANGSIDRARRPASFKLSNRKMAALFCKSSIQGLPTLGILSPSKLWEQGEQRDAKWCLQVPPSPPRWSRIPFDILEEVQRREKRPRFGDSVSTTCISDIPEPILAIIFTRISDTRTRNSMALVCMEWYSLERATRTNLCLRGCVSDLYLIPRSFQAVECLDLSHCSPWGYSLFPSMSERAVLVGQVLKQAFPKVKYMTIYVRDARDIDMVACFWPDVQSLKLVRWHQRPTQFEEASGLGMEFRFLMQSCKSLQSLDLSEFYCWTEDIPPALMMEPFVSKNLRCLNLLKVSVEGFKASELEAITRSCPNLEDLRIVLVFDPRLLDFVDDDALLHLGASCKKLKVLQLIDTAAFNDAQGDREYTFDDQDAQIGRQGLEGVFQALPLLEDLAIVLSQNVWDVRPILEALASHCRRLTSLCLGHFHGLCNGPQPNGIAMCTGLKNLTIKCCADLSNLDLIAIASGCTGLQKLALHSCKEISRAGLHSLARQLKHNLVDVQVTCCVQMDAVDTLWALQPIQGTIVKLLVDFQLSPDFVASELEGVHKSQPQPASVHETTQRVGKEFVGPSATKLSNAQFISPELGDATDKPLRVHSHEILNLNFAPIGQESDTASNSWPGGSFRQSSSSGTSQVSKSESVGSSSGVTHGLESELGDAFPHFGNPAFSLAFREGEWSKLKSLHLWIPIGELLSPLPVMGLQFCPSLEEVRIKVEGDCRACPKPKVLLAGISTLASYEALSKLTLDCSEIVGYALSAPQGHMELSLWERWYLQGIERVKFQELDYWPPQDRDANRRGLSLPSAGLISQCATLRKLRLHGTINEHLLRMFLKVPNLRDVQLRLDYYPAPEVELNTETRADACIRFEAALSERGFPD